MPPSLHDLLTARVTQAFDVDADGRLLVGDDASGSVQLYEIGTDGEWTQLTDLGESCYGRYLPGERTAIVEHDTGGNERGQLSLIRLDDSTRELVPVVRDERYIHRIVDVQPGQVIYATNRRNGVDFDVVIRNVANGGERVVYDGGGLIDTVAVSPDARHVALVRASTAANSSQLLLYDADSRETAELTPHDELAINENPGWLADGSGFYFTSNSGREFTAVAKYDLAGRSWAYVETGDGDVTGWPSPAGSRLLRSTHRDGADELSVGESRVDIPAGSVVGWLRKPVWSPDGRRVAFQVSSPTEPGDVYVWHDGTTRRVTDSSASLDKSALVTPEFHRIATPDREQIPCFLYRPEEGDGSVVVLVHGGPESESALTWNAVLQAIVANGHAVAVPNVRGSTGYGKRWYALDDVRRRLDSVADLAAIHSWLPAAGLDPSRAALYGGSYGGYMVLAGLSMQPELWAAAVDIVGISSLVTFLENTSAYRRAAREREYGTLAEDREFLVAASPLTHVDEIRAPLLILHGANDPRVPLSEAEQLAAAVRARGVECELHVYSDEGHGLAKRHNKLDAYPRAIDFLNRHLTKR